MFIKLKKKIKKTRVKILFDEQLMKAFFNEKISAYFPGAKRVKKVEINILRNFLGKFKNLTIKYTLTIDFSRKEKKKSILAKVNTLTTMPERWTIIAKILTAYKFKNIPLVLDYLPAFNMVLYGEVKGISLQDLLAQKKIIKIIKIIPRIARLLKKFHQLKINDFFIIKDEKEEKREHRHWLFLIKKSLPLYKRRFEKDYHSFLRFKEKNKNLLLKEKNYILNHNDFHFGNLVLGHQKITIIDFSETDLYDPLNDVANFLAQSESMLRYYLPKKFASYRDKIENLFFKNYFKREITEKEKIRLIIFKARSFLQMAAILSFITWPPKDKIRAVKKSLKLAERELKMI